ncbi:hypothetical protein BDW67DRAFT_27022 [Aspergillus spinulosporus]
MNFFVTCLFHAIVHEYSFCIQYGISQALFPRRFKHKGGYCTLLFLGMGGPEKGCIGTYPYLSFWFIFFYFYFFLLVWFGLVMLAFNFGIGSASLYIESLEIMHWSRSVLLCFCGRSSP